MWVLSYADVLVVSRSRVGVDELVWGVALGWLVLLLGLRRLLVYLWAVLWLRGDLGTVWVQIADSVDSSGFASLGAVRWRSTWGSIPSTRVRGKVPDMT